MFQEEIPGLLIVRVVKFIIDIIIKTELVCKPSYRMWIVELDELKRRVDKLLNLGFVRPSHLKKLQYY